MYRINRDRCIGCGVCANRCPAGAINMLEKSAFINPELCTGCGACHEMCHSGAVIRTGGEPAAGNQPSPVEKE